MNLNKFCLIRLNLRCAPIGYWLICSIASIIGFGVPLSTSFWLYARHFGSHIDLASFIDWHRFFTETPAALFLLLSLLLLGTFLTSFIGMGLFFYKGTSIEFNSPTSITFHMSFLDTLLNWIKAYFLFPSSKAHRLEFVRAYKQRLIDTRRTWLVPLLVSLGVKKVVIKSHFFGISEDRCKLKMIAIFGNAIESLEIGALRKTPYFDRLQYFIFEWMGATIRNKSRTIVVNLKLITNLKAVK